VVTARSEALTARVVRLALVLVTMVLLQVALFPHLKVAGVAPDLVLVATVVVAYRTGPDRGALFGFASGLALDLFLRTPLGLSALAGSVAGYVVGLVAGALVRSRRGCRRAGLLGGSGWAEFVLVGPSPARTALTLRSARVVAIASVYDALLTPLLFPSWRGRRARQRGGPQPGGVALNGNIRVRTSIVGEWSSPVRALFARLWFLRWRPRGTTPRRRRATGSGRAIPLPGPILDARGRPLPENPSRG